MLNCVNPARLAPASDDDSGETSLSSLFSFINNILKRDVIAETKNETNLEVGDKIKSQDGTFSLEINTFGPHQAFPVTFEPFAGDDLLDDKKITKVGGDFHDESAEYVLKDKTTNSTSVQHPTELTNSTTAPKVPTTIAPTTTNKSKDENKSTTVKS